MKIFVATLLEKLTEQYPLKVWDGNEIMTQSAGGEKAPMVIF